MSTPRSDTYTSLGALLGAAEPERPSIDSAHAFDQRAKERKRAKRAKLRARERKRG